MRCGCQGGAAVSWVEFVSARLRDLRVDRGIQGGIREDVIGAEEGLPQGGDIRRGRS